jgi:hypothetical protein
VKFGHLRWRQRFTVLNLGPFNGATQRCRRIGIGEQVRDSVPEDR